MAAIQAVVVAITSESVIEVTVEEGPFAAVASSTSFLWASRYRA